MVLMLHGPDPKNAYRCHAGFHNRSCFNKRFEAFEGTLLRTNSFGAYPEEKQPPAQEPQGAELIDSVLDVVRKEAEGGRPQCTLGSLPLYASAETDAKAER